MADANTSSTQQASDAQHVDNMTSMQQSTPDAPSGARSDAPVQTNNVGSQDGPSQLNSNPTGNSTNSNNLGGGLQNSTIIGGSSGNVGSATGLGAADAIGAGVVINGLTGNASFATGEPGQAEAGNAGRNAVASTGARAAGRFTGAEAGNTSAGETAPNGATGGGGEGGGGNTPATTDAPTNATNTILPIDAPTTAEPAFTAIEANEESNSSGQPIFPVTEAGGIDNAIAGIPSVSNTLISADSSAFTVITTPISSTSGYGTYTMDANGTWNYTLNNSNATVQALNVGATLTDTFTVSTVDGALEEVIVRITASNDSAVVSGVTSGTVVEAGGINNATLGTPIATGLLISADVDNLSTFTAVTTPTASTSGYGTYTMATDGAWSYSLNNDNAAVQKLNVGSALTDTFTVTTIDGTARVVTVTITGANDNAVIAAATTDTFGSFTGEPTSFYFQDAYFEDLTSRLVAETAIYDAAALSLSLNIDYGNAVTTYSSALQSYNDAVKLGLATDDELLALHIDLEIAFGSMLELSAERDIAQSKMEGTEYEIAYYNPGKDDLLRNSTLISQGVISIVDIDSVEQFQAEIFPSRDGNIGTLVLKADGSYTYQITSVPMNDDGRYDPLGSNSETYILESFTTLFNLSNNHIDTFTVSSADFTTKDINFILKGDHNILGYVINTPGIADRQESTGNLEFAAGTHDVRIIEGSNFNPNFGPNIGSLILNEDGSYTYTVSESAVAEFGDFISGRDTFIITSTVGTDITISEMSFNIFQQGHITFATSSDLSLDGQKNKADVFAFTTMETINAGEHVISDFELGDRIDLSTLLKNPAYQLRGAIDIDPSNLSSQQSILSVFNSAGSGSVTELSQVASVNGVWSIADLMWNERSGIDQSSALNEASSWTETLDLSNVTKVSDNRFNGAGGWWLEIISDTDITEGTGQITFDGKDGQVTIHSFDGSHDISNIDKIVWHTP